MVNWHKFFTSILDTISDGVFISDAMGTTLYVNQMYADLVGVPARDLRGKNVRDLVSEGFFDLALNPEVVRTGKPGYFEIADGSTIFLDEVGELPLSMQTRLLRVLQDNEIVRVGSSQPRKVDVRIIAATNRNLEECVEAGTFRRDLFYRLNVGTVRIPPLRERPEDVRVLAELFLRQYTTKYRKKLAFMDITLDMLAQYRWPGNVRELQNLVHSLVITRQGPRISPRDLPSNISGLHDESGGHLDAVLMQARPLREIIADMERDFLRRAIEVHGSVRRVSELFQVNRSTIFRKLQGSKGHDKDEDAGSAS